MKSYDVKENDRTRYSAVRKGFFPMGMSFNDTSGVELMHIKPKSLLATRSYLIMEGDRRIGEVKKDMFSNRYQFETNDTTFIIKGNFFGSVFTVFDGEHEIAKVSRKRKLFKIIMNIAIQEGYDHEMLLCFFLVPILVAKRRSK